MHAEGFAAGELKHGPIALIEDGTPVVCIVPSPAGRGMLHDKIVSNIQEVRARGARTIVIAEEGDEAVMRVRRPPDRGAAYADAARPAGDDGAAADFRGGDRLGPRVTTSTSRATSPSRSRSSRHAHLSDLVAVADDDLRDVGERSCAGGEVTLVWSRSDGANCPDRSRRHARRIPGRSEPDRTRRVPDRRSAGRAAPGDVRRPGSGRLAPPSPTRAPDRRARSAAWSTLVPGLPTKTMSSAVSPPV